jgi:hypothetical protein
LVTERAARSIPRSQVIACEYKALLVGKVQEVSIMKIIYRIGFLVLALVAIMSAIASAYRPVDVSIRFNGGGSHNKVYVGRDNIMEILVRNDAAIIAIKIGFQFTSSSGSFSWVTPYGTKPAGAPYVKEHGDVIGAFDITNGIVTNRHLPDTILIGGIASVKTLPPHTSPTVFASMKLRIPAGQQASPSGFCVDNIWVPPVGDWTVNVYIDTLPVFPPTFNGHENTSAEMPDAPPICFDIVAQSFIRGDMDDNMTVDLADLTRLINYMFFNGPAPKYPESADVNGDGRLNIADVVFLVRYIFSGGPEPAW